MWEGYIFMRKFKCNRNTCRVIIKFLCIFIVIVVCGVLYSCQNKNNDSGIKIEQAGDQLLDGLSDSSLLMNNGTEGNITVNDDILQNDSETLSCKCVYVHITGYVVNPGVYSVNEGARIYEVIQIAGGFLPEADESYLNLASVVFDGQKIQVLSIEEAKTAKPFVGATDSETSKKLININTATKEELMQLSGIGESRALSIIAYREKNGEFDKITDIMKVAGIKEAAFEKIKDYICTE